MVLILFAVENYFFWGQANLGQFCFTCGWGYYKLRGKIWVKWNITSGLYLYKINRGSLDLVGSLWLQFKAFLAQKIISVDFDYAIHINLCLIAITQLFCNNCLVHDDLRVIPILPVPGGLSNDLISKKFTSETVRNSLSGS